MAATPPSVSSSPVFYSNAPSAAVVCVECGAPAPHLFKEYGAAGCGNVRLTRCRACLAVCDRYVEFEPALLAIDAMLLRGAVFRHLLVNRNQLAPFRGGAGTGTQPSQPPPRGLRGVDAARALIVLVAADAYSKLYLLAAAALQRSQVQVQGAAPDAAAAAPAAAP